MIQTILKTPRSARGLCFSVALSTFFGFSLACDRAAQSKDVTSTSGNVVPSGPRAQAEPTVSLEPTFDSPEALARTFLDALAREDGATLNGLALTEQQFRQYVWPQLPASLPERNVSFEYGWGDLYQKSHNALLFTFDELKGERMEFLEIRFENGMTDYHTYVVHRDARVRVRRADGREQWLDLFGSVMEWRGRYKLFSNVTD